MNRCIINDPQNSCVVLPHREIMMMFGMVTIILMMVKEVRLTVMIVIMMMNDFA